MSEAIIGTEAVLEEMRRRYKSEVMRWCRRAAELARAKAFVEMNDLGKRYVKYPTIIDDVLAEIEKEMDKEGE